MGLEGFFKDSRDLPKDFLPRRYSLLAATLRTSLVNGRFVSELESEGGSDSHDFVCPPPLRLQAEPLSSDLVQHQSQLALNTHLAPIAPPSYPSSSLPNSLSRPHKCPFSIFTAHCVFFHCKSSEEAQIPGSSSFF